MSKLTGSCGRIPLDNRLARMGLLSKAFDLISQHFDSLAVTTYKLPTALVRPSLA
jgi:hypothetical protein